MRAVFQKALSTLLALLFFMMAGWQNALALANPAAPACSCCNADRSGCATPACCARPSDNREPVTPAAPRCAAGHELNVIATTALTLFTISPFTLYTFSADSAPSRAGAVPIFQRNCSFLI
jgi:hypothetical protein